MILPAGFGPAALQAWDLSLLLFTAEGLGTESALLQAWDLSLHQHTVGGVGKERALLGDSGGSLSEIFN